VEKMILHAFSYVKSKTIRRLEAENREQRPPGAGGGEEGEEMRNSVLFFKIYYRACQI
jgi:hypothetical protein